MLLANRFDFSFLAVQIDGQGSMIRNIWRSKHTPRLRVAWLDLGGELKHSRRVVESPSARASQTRLIQCFSKNLLVLGPKIDTCDCAGAGLVRFRIWSAAGLLKNNGTSIDWAWKPAETYGPKQEANMAKDYSNGTYWRRLSSLVLQRAPILWQSDTAMDFPWDGLVPTENKFTNE